MGETAEIIHATENFQEKFNQFKKVIEDFKKDIQEKYIIKEKILQNGFSKEFGDFKQNIDDFILTQENFIRTLLNEKILKGQEVKISWEDLGTQGLKATAALLNLDNMIKILNKLNGKFTDLTQHFISMTEKIKDFVHEMVLFNKDTLKIPK